MRLLILMKTHNKNETIQIRKIRTIDNLKDNIVFMNLLKDGRIAACLENYTVAIFNKNIFTVLDYLTGHRDTVTSIFQLWNGNLVTSSVDRDIKVWKCKGIKYHCVHTIAKAHEHWIGKVIELRAERFASCSTDLKIKIWIGVEPYNMIKELEGHKGYVTCITEMREKYFLISGSVDGELRFWNTRTLQCESIFKNINCYTKKNIIEIENNRVVIAEMTSLTVINVVKMIIERIVNLNMSENIICLNSIKRNYIVCGCKGGKIVFLDDKFNVVLNKKIHNKSIKNILVYNSNIIVSGGFDNRIKIWKYE